MLPPHYNLSVATSDNLLMLQRIENRLRINAEPNRADHQCANRHTR